MREIWPRLTLVLVAVLALFVASAQVSAADSSSSNYQITNTSLGSGGSGGGDNCSNQYCARVTIGDPTDSNTIYTSSSTFETLTEGEPSLDVIVDPGISNMGTLSTTVTGTKTTTLRVRTYLSSGYIVQIVGDAPHIANHTLDAMSVADISKPGTEQFGINLVANSTPNFGVDPIQVPSGQFAFGIANTDYDTANIFKYVSGDTIAHSSSETGRTDYTISMIVNVSNNTPAGHYSSDLSLIVIPVY